jgi:hypothetical protein
VNGDNKTDGTQLQTIFVKGYQEYGSTANSIPTEDDTPSVDDTLVYMGASLPLLTARDVSPSDYIQTTAFQPYQANGVTDLFLSDVESSLVIMDFQDILTMFKKMTIIQWRF